MRDQEGKARSYVWVLKREREVFETRVLKGAVAPERKEKDDIYQTPNAMPLFGVNMRK